MKSRRVEAPSRYMTASEVAGYLRIHVSSVYRLIRLRQLPAFKIDGNYRFDRTEIDKWMADRKTN
jgi:excisionase family DNA binding protein